MKLCISFFMLVLLSGCDVANKPIERQEEQLIDALIIGSAESPDPVLIRVEALEKKGIVKDVVILESYPVQIHLKATKKIIEELNNISRVDSQLQ